MQYQILPRSIFFLYSLLLCGNVCMGGSFLEESEFRHVLPLLEEKPRDPPSYPFQDGKKNNTMGPIELKALVQLEWTIYHQIKFLFHKYRNQTRGILRKEFDETHEEIKSYLDNFEQSFMAVVNARGKYTLRGARRSEKVAWNPLAIFRLITRFRDYIQPWLSKDANPAMENTKLQKEIISHLHKVYQISKGPTANDYKWGSEGILQIQYVYAMNVEDISVGRIGNMNATVVLNAKDCLQIGKHAIFFKYYKQGLQWLRHSLHLVVNKSDSTANNEDILRALDKAEIKHDDDFKTDGWDDSKYFWEPIHKIIGPANEDSNPIHLYKHNWFKTINHEVPEKYNKETELHAICRGFIQQDGTDKEKLFCFYEREIHPSFKIGPLKAEFHAILPKIEVVQYYDVLGSKFLKELQTSPFRDIYRGTVSNEDVTLELRINSTKIVTKLANTLKRFSGLRIPLPSDREFFSLSESPAGSYYMSKLSDVAHGGELVFTESKIKIGAKKGSAVLWSSLYSCKKENMKAWYGICPVVFGEQFYIPMWTHYDDQHHLQCHLKQEKGLEILVNGNSKLAQAK